jgi:hypothetical protein
MSSFLFKNSLNSNSFISFFSPFKCCLVIQILSIDDISLGEYEGEIYTMEDDLKQLKRDLIIKSLW